MSSALRTLHKHSRTLSAASRVAHTRAFHSPFVSLSKHESPAPPARGLYEKNIQYDSEPFTSGSGHRTYVVSTPDPANMPYEVPSGAYPTSAPYQVDTRADSAASA